MHMHWIDWTIAAAFLAGLLGIAAFLRRYTRSVADFLTANRSAGRYLLTTAEGAAGLGVIAVAGSFEKFYEGGLGAAWWGTIFEPVGLFLALSAWVIYRYRQTRAMTFPQFFEMRYSRRFRIFAGMIGFGAGLISYGIYPAVTARFLIHFCGLPRYGMELGGLQIDLTLACVMACLLGIALTMTLCGGQIVIMVTDFLQGMMFNVVFLLMMVFLVSRFSVSGIAETLYAAPPGHSMLNPFDQENVKGFTVSFFLILAFMNIYAYKAWLDNSGYRASAKSPHEAKMAGVLAGWRGIVSYFMMMLAPICVYVLLHNPAYAPLADEVRSAIAAVPDQQLQTQMTVPIALTHLLPIGVVGLVVAGLLSSAVSTDDTALHSWGSIFVQDVLLPLRGEDKPLSPRQHLLLLRCAALGVALFAFVFSLLFPIQEYIIMFLTAAQAVYIGGAGAVIIGGLYWKRGSTAGAWAAMSLGAGVSLAGILLRNVVWPFILPGLRESHADWAWLQSLPKAFPLNGVQMTFVAALSAIAGYVVFSLLSRQPAFDLDRMLHRGAYAPSGQQHRRVAGWRGRLGMTSEFTRGDRLIYYFKIGWAMFWFVTFLVGTIAALLVDIPDHVWARYWMFRLSVIALAAAVTVVWFMIGGLRDLADLLRTLRTARRDAADNGMVRASDAGPAPVPSQRPAERDAAALVAAAQARD